MDPPLGFQAEGEYSGKVCCLCTSLYELKQSPWAWFSPSEVILGMDFLRCQSNHTCFIRKCLDGHCILLSIYADDITITGDDASSIIKVKQDLGRLFDVKELAPFRYFPSIDIACSFHGISLSQPKYTLDMLQDTSMLGCRPAFTPMDPNLKLSVKFGDLFPDPSVSRLFGHIFYLTNTRPYLTFVVHESIYACFTNISFRCILSNLTYLKSCSGLWVILKI